MKPVLWLLLAWLLIHPLRAEATTIISPIVELTVAAGEIQRGIVKVYNETDATLFLTSTIEPLRVANTPDELIDQPSNQDTNYLGWFTLDNDSIVLQPRQVAIIPFTVTVPVGARPGGYYAVIFWQTEPSQNGNPSPIGISSKVGTTVLLSIEGETVQRLELLNAEMRPSGGYIFNLPVSFSVVLKNVGNIHLAPAGYVELTHWWGKTVTLPINPSQRPLLPGTTRQFDVVWGQAAAGSWPERFWQRLRQDMQAIGGPINARIKVAYGAAETPVIEQQFQFWFIPLRLIASIGTVIVLFVLLLIIKSKRARALKAGAEKKR